MKNTFTQFNIKAIYLVFILLLSVPLFAQVPAFDSDKPTTTVSSIYTQDFTGGSASWDAAFNTKFYNQWETVVTNIFAPVDIANNYLQFTWGGTVARRIMVSKALYDIPYTMETDFSYGVGSNRGGIVIRANPSYLDNIQVARKDPGFNLVGIAIYPADANNMVVQFNGVISGLNGVNTPRTQIQVPKPAGVASLLGAGRGILRIEDFGASVYVYYNGVPFIRINITNPGIGNNSSGEVFDANMVSKGTFTGMEVLGTGKVSIAQRDAKLQLFNTTITQKQLQQQQPLTFDGDKPTATFNQFVQDFSQPWDGSSFYSQWEVINNNAFGAADSANGYLQFQWSPKRIMISKALYRTPYTIQADLDYTGIKNSFGGIVVRSNSTYPDYVQEPILGDPGYNSVGIAFYPSVTGDAMIVQFNGVLNGKLTPRSQILVPKPAGIVSLRDRGKLRVEDFGTSIYVYYNDIKFIRINLGDKLGDDYTSGTVYDAALNVVGTFSGMEVKSIGKVAIAQRDTGFKLFGVIINSNQLQEQLIAFDNIDTKKINDAPFTINAIASSGLAVTYKIISGPATLAGNKITLTGQTGTVTIAANQSGNANFFPAPEVTASFYVSDPSLPPVTSSSQDYVDNWVATDALGRELPSFDVAGGKRADKIIGVFYYIWAGAQGNRVYDISKIIKQYPSDPLSASNPGWGGTSAFHFWGEPEQGYYRSEDPWVLRRDLQMLSNAHVDFLYLDVTNGLTYPETVKSLCAVSTQMRLEGIYTPQIVFTTNARSGLTINKLYDEFYSKAMYTDLWYQWEGKPLIFGLATDPVLRPEVKDFFTIKYSWAWTDAKNKPNHWQWLDYYPQDYGWSADPSIAVQIPVTSAQHPTSSIGKSYSKGIQPSVDADYLTPFTGQGLNFAEQWSRALQVDPTVIMVTQWNEWIAQRAIAQSAGTFAGKPTSAGDTFFVDVFNQEFNRDIAPMKGGYTDNYYYQLISNIRKYKGMAAPQTVSTPVTINVDGIFSEWSTVTPIFKDPVGDVMHRNYMGYDITKQLLNNTGRNDIVESRSTYDANNVFFYVKTKEALSPYTDPNWMLLFIDADRNKSTGWEGYDYVVNLGVKSATQTVIKKWNGTTWSNEITVPYKVDGNQMELSVPKAAMQMDSANPQFYFHWADNLQQLNNIESFFTDGDSAPDRRFNFNYSTNKVVPVEQTSYKALTIPGTVEFEDFDNGGAGVAYGDATFGNSGGAYRNNESVDIETKVGGGYNLKDVNANEYLMYTVNISSIGKFTATINYATSTAGSEAIIYVDGVAVSDIISLPSTGDVNTWADKSVDILLTSGKHLVKFFIKNASSDLKLDKIVFTEKGVVYPSNGNGLNKSFYAGAPPSRFFTSPPVCTEIDPVIDEVWGDVSPGCDLFNDFWSIRWEGEIDPLFTELYTFYLTGDDLARLFINNEQIINGWSPSSTGNTLTATIALTAGQRLPIKVDFAEKTGGAYVKLEWSSASNPRQVVPQAQLFSSALSNEDFNKKGISFQVYPNPATNKITINSGADEVQGISIIDLTGRIVYKSSESFTGIKSFNINLAKGNYLVKLKGSKPFEVHKLIIK